MREQLLVMTTLELLPGLPANCFGCGGAPPPQVGCKALAFPKQFKTQQYYNILKQICPEVEKAQPGSLKSQR